VVNLEFDLINLRNELDITSEDRSREKIEKVRPRPFSIIGCLHPCFMLGGLNRAPALLLLRYSVEVSVPDSDAYPMCVRSQSIF
jgi:hypothetical protein